MIFSHKKRKKLRSIIKLHSASAYHPVRWNYPFNVCSTEKYTRPSSVLLLRLVYFSAEQTLYHFCNQAQIEHYANIYRPQWDCLSEQSSKLLLEKIKPRLVLSGHTHHGCKNLHTLPNGGKVPEWSVASFSWRNRNNPVIVLATLTQEEFVLNKCYLPQESTVINIYILGSFLIFLYALANRRKIFRRF